MHECNFEQTNFSDDVIKYYCKGCKKGWFDKKRSFTSAYYYI